ncbi:MAG TPA: SLC13 family permease [Steroidobacteraceae bacterium]|nr:SLC13 family permease [Steroidobacteraceae bacterium]
MPGPHAIVLLVVTLAAFFLYARPWIRIELVSLLLLLALVVLFYVLPFGKEAVRVTDAEIFEAFGHPALIAICSLMILGRGLTVTGAMEPAVRLLGRLWAFNRSLGMLFTLAVAGAASAFINDTPVLVLLLPLLLGLSSRTGYPASKTLMPVNFAILAGGMLTSIGTSTNLLVLNIAQDLGMRPVGLFDFTATAVMGFAVALPYLWLIAPRLLPVTGAEPAAPSRRYEARIKIEDENKQLVGRTLEDVARTLGRPLPVVGLVRDDRDQPIGKDLKLTAGDALLLRDTPTGLRELASALHVDLYDRRGLERFVESDHSKADIHLAEVVIGNDSNLVGRTLKSARFAEQHELAVIGLNRGTPGLLHDVGNIADTPLGVGDVLLVQAPEDRIEKLRSVAHLLLLDSSLQLPRSPLAPIALTIMGSVILIAAIGLLPIHVAAFMGVVAMLLTNCVRLEGIGNALSLEVVLLVASSIALGQALVTTGAAGWIAQGVASLLDDLPPALQLAALMTFATLLTNFVSNAAAASVGTPIAVATANQLGVPIEPFVLAILFGANLSYATPMAYQTNLLVMSAAGYRFADFVRVGVPLVVLMLVTLSSVLARRYGL